MDGKSGNAVLTVAVLGAFVLAVSGVNAQSGTGHAAKGASGSAPKTTERVYKNIKVLKGVPADQLIPAMEFITASLGVRCDFCHVEGHFDKDDKKPKGVARKMMTMMFAINKDNFDNHREVTCYSCHRGAAKPVGTPLVGEEAPKPMMAGAGASPSAKIDLSKLPSPNDVIEKYAQAAGGAAAIEKISSRVEKGTATGFGGRTFATEIYTKAPHQIATVTSFPNGQSITSYNGEEGWMTFPGRGAREMGSADLEAARVDADLHLAVDLPKMFAEFKVAAPEKIDGQEAYHILAMKPGNPPTEFYFDEQSGLLVRQVRYAESPLGLYPTQIDYADYRDQDGVKIPFQVTTSHPGNASTFQAAEVQENVAIDEAKFGKPAMAAPPERQ
jgi:photosynthetic reaction center cytochrome c subunit